MWHFSFCPSVFFSCFFVYLLSFCLPSHLSLFCCFVTFCQKNKPGSVLKIYVQVKFELEEFERSNLSGKNTGWWVFLSNFRSICRSFCCRKTANKVWHRKILPKPQLFADFLLKIRRGRNSPTSFLSCIEPLGCCW